MRVGETRIILCRLAEDIDKTVNPTDKLTTGFCLLLFPFEKPLAVDSISNIASLTELAAILRKQADRLEETPEPEGSPFQ